MKLKKIVSIILLILILVNSMSGIANAFEVNSAYVENLGDCGQHLQFKTTSGIWSYVITTMVGYRNNGVLHYAYCLNVDKHGVGEEQNYSVNVTEILSDVQVWRAIVNGFPYKSASELGVENDQDAFVATKQAVYSVIYNRDVDSFYRGGDARGTKIFNAIKNIVNQARYGSETPSANSVLNANKIGGFKADGSNYYSQEYSVTSNVNVSNYTVTSISNFPEGSYIADLSGNAKTTFSGNENFKIKIPTSQMNKDINITFRVRGKAKTYPVFYGKTRIAETQNYAVTFDPLGDVVGVGKLNVKTNTGRIQINKTDDETSKPISGVTFQLTKADGTVVANSTTNENGVATFSGLYQDNYKLKEISTNAKYVLNTKEFDVNVEYNGTTIKDITNEHKKGNLKIYKVDKDNHKIALGNVKFDLYSEEFKKVIGTYTTNVDGEIQINNLRIGQYKLIEKNTGKWYNLAEDKTIEVKWNTTEENTIENELKKGQVKVIKVDKDNNEVKLEGVEFEVLDENNKVLEKIVTDKNGEALTSRYPIRDFEKLKIRET